MNEIRAIQTTIDKLKNKNYHEKDNENKRQN